MFSQINSCGLMGMDGFLVTVQTDISNGLPNFEIVGLPDTAVKEAKERVRAAIKNTKLQFPSKRIIINLSPASQKKGGTSFDLPITVSILCATEQVSHSDLDNSVFIGEVSLDGSISSVDGVLPMVIHAFKNGYRDMYVPYDNANEAAVVDGATIYPVKTLQELCDHLNGVKKIIPHTVDVKELFKRRYETLLDFSDVKGQENVKRALEIAAAGNHNVLMIGSPGTGKTMLAQRMGSILPDLTFDEALDVTKIHSIAGVLKKSTPLITHRPFRSPHHTVSAAGLSGGGSVPRPGELSLAHNGILFLDELPEFNRNVLEILRQPLEDGVVTISRVQATLTYPCNIMLIASMNPCKCGYLGDSKRQCTCTPRQINQYRSKISGPLLDRIDIQVEVPSVNYKELSSTEKGEISAEIKKRVDRTRQIQLERYKDINIHSNSELSAGLLQKYCRLDDTANNLLRAAFDNLGLSARAHGRILKVARTIADLDMSEDIKAEHIAEAIQYRSLDRKYFE